MAITKPTRAAIIVFLAVDTPDESPPDVMYLNPPQTTKATETNPAISARILVTLTIAPLGPVMGSAPVLPQTGLLEPPVVQGPSPPPVKGSKAAIAGAVEKQKTADKVTTDSIVANILIPYATLPTVKLTIVTANIDTTSPTMA
jgi:hypothetical protein